MQAPNERLVFIDIETTGLQPSSPIIQVAAIATDCRARELESIEIKIRLPRNATIEHRHSRYDATVWKQSAQSPRKAAIELAKFFSRHGTVDLISQKGSTFRVAQLVAHNAEFDTSFLRNWFEGLGIFLPASYRPMCTLQRALWLFDENKSLTPPANFKLGTLCEYFGVPLRDAEAHEALADVRAMLSLYREMTKVHSANIRSLHTRVAAACG